MRPEDALPPKQRQPLRARGAVLAGLLALTLAAGVAARIATAPPTGGGDLSHSHRSGAVRLDATLDRGSVLAGGDGLLRVELVVAADEVPSLLQGGAPRTPTDLVVILDRSGSMQGAPLAFAKAAVFELLGRLGAEDRFGLVTYATGGEVAVALAPATHDARRRWQARVGAVHAGGGTNMARGLDLAHQLVEGARAAGRAPRVILISDGHANQGDHSLAGLRTRAGRAIGAEYVLSAVGVGQGFDENVMSSISDAGTGNFYYLPDVRELAGVFADEFASARERVAHALEILVAPGAGVQVTDAAGLPLTRGEDGVRFRPGDLFAGQERRIYLTLRAPTREAGTIDPGRVSLFFTDAEGVRRELGPGALPRIACVAAEEDYWASFDAEVYRRSAAEGIGALKQKVARKIRAGLQGEATAEVDAYLEDLKLNQMRALGYVVKDDVDALRSLRGQVAAPAAAEPEVRNRLGKELHEAGRDERRVGSKRK